MAALAAALAAGVTLLLAAQHPGQARDFDQFWVAARALLSGHSPYGLIGPGRPFDWRWPFVYPLSSALVVVPLSALPVVVARACFVGLSVGLLAYARRGILLLPLLVSQPFVNALWNAQWSPLLTAAILLPGLAWLAIVKPQTGVAILAYKPARRTMWIAVAGAAALCSLATVLQPGWIREWLEVLRSAPPHVPPILRPGGFVLLLAIFRLRLPEGRLLLVLALMPQTAMWYTALPLFLIPKTLAEGTILAGLSQIAFLLTAVVPVGPSWPEQERLVGLLMLGALYIPCLIMVLRRPARAGSAPSGVEVPATGPDSA
jgi:hypothetical protein